jgi:hypothetical protein
VIQYRQEAGMTSCTGCGAEIERAFRFCPWCGRAQRLKLTEFFLGHPAVEGGVRRALRVSRYFGEEPMERHVRFSVWSESGTGKTRVEAAVSLDEDEAERVARFLGSGEDARQPDGRLQA